MEVGCVTPPNNFKVKKLVKLLDSWGKMLNQVQVNSSRAPFFPNI